MKAQDIVNQLSRELPKHTDGFSNKLDILSAVVAGTTVTVTTDGAHGLVSTQNVAIEGVGAPVEINAASFLRTGTSAVFETDQDHDLTLSPKDIQNGGKTVTISGAAEAEFNGTFELAGVLSRRKLVIAVADSGPTTISGTPIVENANGGVFNGLFPVTVTGSDTFTYELASAYPLDGVANGAQVTVSLRIISVLDIEQYLTDVYTKKAIDDDILVVQLGDVTQSKSRREQTDAASSSSGQYAYNPVLIQPFALYIVMNVTDDLTGSTQRDIVEGEYIPAIFKAVLRAPFDSQFTYNGFRATFTGHGVFAYSSNLGKNKAIYAHEVTFEQLVQLTKADMVPPDSNVAMRDVDYTITTDLGDGTLTGNVDLDENAEPEV